jgi:hypothetical protein
MPSICQNPFRFSSIQHYNGRFGEQGSSGMRLVSVGCWFRAAEPKNPGPNRQRRCKIKIPKKTEAYPVGRRMRWLIVLLVGYGVFSSGWPSSGCNSRAGVFFCTRISRVTSPRTSRSRRS